MSQSGHSQKRPGINYCHRQLHPQNCLGRKFQNKRKSPRRWLNSQKWVGYLLPYAELQISVYTSTFIREDIHEKSTDTLTRVSDRS
jgi:hypothetical protein